MNSVEAPAHSFDALYKQHYPFVRRSLAGLGVAGMDLDDVCHEVFLVIHRRLDVFRALDGARPWLYEVCRRTASAQRRRAFRHIEIPTAEPEEWGRWDLAPAGHADGDGKLLAALRRLDPARREILLYSELVDV